MATKIVIWGGQILTEDFISKRILEQQDYLLELPSIPDEKDLNRVREKWISAKAVLDNFVNLQLNLKSV